MLSDSFIIVVIAVASMLSFLSVGYFFGRFDTWQGMLMEKKDTPDRLTHARVKSQVKSGIIDYPTQAEIDYRESGEEAVDKERERVFREQFKP